MSAAAVLAPLAAEVAGQAAVDGLIAQKWKDCGQAIALDLMVQAIVLSALHSSQSPSEWGHEISLPNALVSCGTSFLDNCGDACQVIANGAAGVADDLVKQIGEGKELGDLDYLRAINKGTIQAAIGLAAGKSVGWLVTSISKLLTANQTLSKEYTTEEVLSLLTERSAIYNSGTLYSEFFDGQALVFLDDKVTQVGTGYLENGFIKLEINVKIGDEGAKVAKGSDVFNLILSRITEDSGPEAIKGVSGTWFSGLGDNLDTFNNLILTKVNVGVMTIEEAALNTFTGKMASRNGYSKVLSVDGAKNVDGTYKYVTSVKFVK
ncbi:hypothetical protein [Spirosoma foliorum]|uniref:Uncharacterized protein n=1 Tax=Spirosoma foliorum TaxID=2710596 RepID=A0A7G5GWT1_9BACT|nr:hypothetical protein [Spirosoma foliorum]QMW03323.1 hypothetical protein H3H32_36640 [Spirosoma foliorum]